MKDLKDKEKKKETILGKDLTDEQIQIAEERQGAWTAFFKCQKHYPESWDELYDHLYILRCSACQQADRQYEGGKYKPKYKELDYEMIMEAMEKLVCHYPKPDLPNFKVKLREREYYFSLREILREMRQNSEIGISFKKALFESMFMFIIK